MAKALLPRICSVVLAAPASTRQARKTLRPCGFFLSYWLLHQSHVSAVSMAISFCGCFARVMCSSANQPTHQIRLCDRLCQYVCAKRLYVVPHAAAGEVVVRVPQAAAAESGGHSPTLIPHKGQCLQRFEDFDRCLTSHVDHLPLLVSYLSKTRAHGRRHGAFTC